MGEDLHDVTTDVCCTTDSFVDTAGNTQQQPHPQLAGEGTGATIVAGAALPATPSSSRKPISI